MKANLKRNFSYHSFILFLLARNNKGLKFTLSGVYNLIHDDYRNLCSHEKLDQEQKKSCRLIINNLQTAIEGFNLPYRIDKVKDDEHTYYYLIKKPIDYSFNFINKDNLEVIKQNPSLFVVVKLLRKEYLSIPLLINIFNSSESAIYRFIEKIDTTLGVITNLRISKNNSILKIVKS